MLSSQQHGALPPCAAPVLVPVVQPVVIVQPFIWNVNAVPFIPGVREHHSVHHTESVGKEDSGLQLDSVETEEDDGGGAAVHLDSVEEEEDDSTGTAIQSMTREEGCNQEVCPDSPWIAPTVEGDLCPWLEYVQRIADRLQFATEKLDDGSQERCANSTSLQIPPPPTSAPPLPPKEVPTIDHRDDDHVDDDSDNWESQVDKAVEDSSTTDDWESDEEGSTGDNWESRADETAPPTQAAEHAKAELPESREAARILFKCVAGILNQAFDVSKVERCEAEIFVWSDETQLSDRVEHAKKEPGAVFWSSLPYRRMFFYSFRNACESLAAAIEADAVPPMAICTLNGLIKNLNKHGIDRRSSKLEMNLKAASRRLLCPHCASAVPAQSLCSNCRGTGEIQCSKCSGTGRHTVTCNRCCGLARAYQLRCPNCKGRGARDLGECFRCQGGVKRIRCHHCDQRPRFGAARPYCTQCVAAWESRLTGTR